MSYKTTTIANRLKITKGWKTSLFPTKKWDYSRETVFWFKLYLFLKAYLALKKIQLLSCETRISEKNTYLLYLSINKMKRKKKKHVRKTLMLKKLKSAFNRQKNKKAKHFLYKYNLKFLKQVSFWKYNNTQQKTITKLWISKPRLFSWINLVHIIKTQRDRMKIHQKIKINKKLLPCNFWRHSPSLSFTKSSEKKYLQFFFELKEKKLLNIFARLQKNILFLQKYLFLFQGNKNLFFTDKNKNLKTTFFFLNKQIKKQTALAKQIYDLYFIIYQQKMINQSSPYTLESTNPIEKKRIQAKWQQTWKTTKKQFKSFAIKTFMKTLGKKKNVEFFHLHSLFYKKTLSYAFLVSKTHYFWKFILEWYFLSSKIKNNKFLIGFLTKKYLGKKTWKFQKRVSYSVFKKKLFPRKLFIFQGIRFQQKLIEKDIFPSEKKKFNYRIPSRYQYIQNLKFSVNYKIKYWLQQVIYKYFHMHFYIKLLWPLSQFKNIKFYRLAFSAKEKKKKQKRRWEKEDSSILKKYPENIFWQNYVYLSKTANPFLKTNIKKSFTKKRPYFSKKWVKIENKKKFRIMPFAHSFFMKNLIPTLTLFVRYLNPQLLADEIAKIIGKAKRHSWFLYDLRRILKSLFLKNIAGYKIVLIGRINGRKKTGLMSIKNAKESNSQQTWLKQVSFGAAQAKGRIGTFGIKVWIYH